MFEVMVRSIARSEASKIAVPLRNNGSAPGSSGSNGAGSTGTSSPDAAAPSLGSPGVP
jgi:hypothetical protein